MDPRPVPLRALFMALAVALCLAMAAFAIFQARACALDFETRSRNEAVTRVYQYACSVSSDAELVVAKRETAFVIPREILKKLVFGLTSRAKVQVSCQATVMYAIPAAALREAKWTWHDRGKRVTLTLEKPVALRPVIETSSVEKAVLERGFLIDGHAEVEKLAAELSGIVAESASSRPDEACLESAGRGLGEIVKAALSGAKKRPEIIEIEWL